jgi:hypothetical protein
LKFRQAHRNSVNGCASIAIADPNWRAICLRKDFGSCQQATIIKREKPDMKENGCATVIQIRMLGESDVLLTSLVLLIRSLHERFSEQKARCRTTMLLAD